MKFTQPAFVRVENPAERKELKKWLMAIGYQCKNLTIERLAPIVVCSSAGYAYSASSVDGKYDAGKNVELFKALAAMNDSNDREQWFVEDIHKPCGIGGQTVGLEPTRKVGEKWFKYENNDLRVTNHIAFEKENSYHRCCLIRKATAEEIVEHFKNQKP